jgi:hypothetical protein
MCLESDIRGHKSVIYNKGKRQPGMDAGDGLSVKKCALNRYRVIIYINAPTFFCSAWLQPHKVQAV